ncbi:phosphate signaling complex protein PhoU [Arcanobacterium haemolyticum]|uniref:Phosphate-specific transport system accessory protein PhoU n=1 Tax=Arcanobacterium haemolyticum (strain ATCC 9345 / DSM 20595 / CCM 5947 / CCUG 17215 / LMG 16163 / NBRC 15585 / NCTC 8452 / 11018) TaxID=644284 RepID=D7BL21_ARCHD|nr:phosphate signaling complex protein PhoU [Arcanobacterium haemolyticum]ADH93351.1 phosphate uptake regulator, PhoU [Arcanobacterium haemolyticum DSM 20595]SPT74837.1 Phosphate transport system protein phoU homolog [Arcanobacterium haemolyticum]SQH27789.1 Phosphate transport system protein phoU homolog [Arcanobacterium haemolyticum]
MREQFRQEMHDLTKTLTLEAQAAAKAMKRAAAALKNANLAVAEQVIDSDSRIDLLERHIDDMGISMLARQAPVASDLRTVVSALRLSSILERMGDLARHVAYVARGRYPQTPVEGDVFAILSRMADQAEIVGKKVAELIETHDLRLADAIIDDDDVLDDLHREIFSIVLDPGHDLSRQEIVDAVLLSRYLERYGDHAVSVANRMRFLVTGLEPN